MAELLPVRAFNRSQRVQVGTKRLYPNVTTLINLTNPKVRRDLSRHSALGAILPVGDIQVTEDSGYVSSGGTVGPESPASLNLTVGAGAARFGSSITRWSEQEVTISAADSTNPRLDLIVVDDAGDVSVVGGTAAASPSNPAVPADSTSLAVVSVPKGDTEITSDQISDVR